MQKYELRYDKQHPVILRLKEDLARKGRYVLIKGDHGSGKSYIAVRLLQDIDKEVSYLVEKYQQMLDAGKDMPHFEEYVERVFTNRIIYSPMKFMEQFDPKTIKPYTVYVFDEAGSALNSWEWQEFYQVGIDKILQVGRKYRVLIVFVVPRSSRLIQSHVRLQFHYMFRTLSVDYQRHENIFKFYELDYHEERKGDYKYILKNLQLMPNVLLKTVSTLRAHPKLVEIYERVSSKKKDEIVQMARGRKSADRSDIELMADEVIERYRNMLDKYGMEELVKMKLIDKDGNIKRAFIESMYPDLKRHKLDKVVSLVKLKLLEGGGV